MSSDQELLTAWRAGDRQAGSTLFDRYFDATAFPLYQGSDGKWYADPAKVPGAVSCP